MRLSVTDPILNLEIKEFKIARAGKSKNLRPMTAQNSI